MLRYIVVVHDPLVNTVALNHLVTESTNGVAAATTAAAAPGMCFTTNDIIGDRKVYSVKNPAAIYSTLYDGPKSSISTFEFMANNDLDAYYRLVINNREFDLQTFINGWRRYRETIGPQKMAFSAGYSKSRIPYIPADGILLEHVFGQLSPKKQTELLEEKETCPRDWITPELAKQMWLIYNDSLPQMAIGNVYESSLSFNNAVPLKHLRHAVLVRADQIKSENLTLPSDPSKK